MPTISTECRFCTVPTENSTAVCSFCADYDPPTPPSVNALLAQSSLNARHAAEDAADALDALPDTASAFAAADIASAIAHLRAARWLIDRANSSLTTVTDHHDGGDR